MVSIIGWIDFSKRDRNITLNVLKLLEEPGAVDEIRSDIDEHPYGDNIPFAKSE